MPWYTTTATATEAALLKPLCEAKPYCFDEREGPHAASRGIAAIPRQEGSSDVD